VGIESADYRRAGAGRAGGIEKVDVEADIAWPLADPSMDRGDRSGDAFPVQPAGIADLEAVAVGIAGAHAQLNRTRRIDQALPGGMEKHGAVVDAALAVGPGVGVGVEVDQRQRPMDLVQRT